MRRSIVVVAGALTLLAGNADAKLYKCTGADGSVSFNDRPCTEGTQEELEQRLPAASPSAAGADAEPAEPGPDAAGRVSGTLGGEPFAFSGGRIFKLLNHVVEIKQGTGPLPESELTIFLRTREGVAIEGARLRYPDPGLSQQPKLVLIWNGSDGERHQKDVERGYTMSIEFGTIENGTIDGRINVALPDRSRLNLDGTFVLDVEL